jgi:cytochrome c oxidase subunit 2
MGQKPMTTNWIRRAAGLSALLAPAGALAQGEPQGLPIIGIPVPGGTGYQPAVTELARDIHWLSDVVHLIMILIVIFVTALLAIVVLRFNRRSNPRPAGFTHNSKLEITWTLAPVLILIVIGSFSLPVLFKELEIPDPDLTIKVTGNQWNWSYEYPDYEMSFLSVMLQRDELEAHGYTDNEWLLATDTSVVVPVGAVVKLQVTGSDVIHSWTIPAFGVKMDAVPGRLNETWFAADTVGIYFGQCSELCGLNHTYMPITVKVVSQDAYDAWLDWAIDEYGGTRPGDAAAEVPPGAAVAEEPAAADTPAEDGAADEQATPTEETEAAIQAEQGLEAEAAGEAEETPADAAEEPVEPAR